MKKRDSFSGRTVKESGKDARPDSAGIVRRLCAVGDEDAAAHAQRFFKTGKGEYGEGDVFLGIRVPVLRALAREYSGTPLEETLRLLSSKYHEARFLALVLLVSRYSSAQSDGERAAVYRAYLRNTGFINNWDLVDCSAENIVGAHLLTRDRKPIYRLAGSSVMWERRIAIVSTFHFIKRNQFDDTFRIAAALMNDREDLIHKASGWMLREAGKRNEPAAKDFISRHRGSMPRTMLRYAIELFPAEERARFMAR